MSTKVAQKTSGRTSTRTLDRPIKLRRVPAESEPHRTPDVLPGANLIARYDLGDASNETLLARVVAPRCFSEPEMIAQGIDLCADELVVLENCLEHAGDLNPEITTHVVLGIGTRLRALAELARRGLGKGGST